MTFKQSEVFLMLNNKANIVYLSQLNHINFTYRRGSFGVPSRFALHIVCMCTGSVKSLFFREFLGLNRPTDTENERKQIRPIRGQIYESTGRRVKQASLYKFFVFIYVFFRMMFYKPQTKMQMIETNNFQYLNLNLEFLKMIKESFSRFEF